MKRLWFMVLLLLAMQGVILHAEPLRFSFGGSTLELSEDGGKLRKLQPGNDTLAFQGNEKTALWRLRFFDAETKQLNTHPLRPEKGGLYWQNPWRDSGNSVSAAEAKLTGHEFDATTGSGTLRYTHPQADVTIRFQLAGNRVELQGEAVNRSADPLTKLELIDQWQLDYTSQDRFILPMVGGVAAIEYRRIKQHRQFMNGVAWDGFLVERPGAPLLAMFLAQPETDGPFMPTETVFQESGPGALSVKISSGVICFRKTGESIRSPRFVFATFPTLRAFADGYWQASQPGMKKLVDKVPDDVREKFAGAVMFPAVGPMNKVAEVVEQLPGCVMLHTPDYMRPAGKAIAWDSFPNYFPPNPVHGDMAQYQELVRRARNAGHLFLPRNSFFYWVDESDVDRKYGLENLAMVRIDGLPRTAQWAIPGYLVSPSSKIVLAELERNLAIWREMGADLYFTNVLSAIGPYGNRYDFHKDAPGPDLFYDQIRKMMKSHGDRIGLFSEEGGHWQTPFQCGFFLRPFWEKGSFGPAHWNAAGRGDAVRLRQEPGLYLYNEYLTVYPHNAITTETVKSIRDLGLSVLYHNGLKYGFSAGAPFRESDWRWLRTLALFGDRVMRLNFGARLLDFQYPEPERSVATYEKLTVAMNDSAEPWPYRLGNVETVIAPGGFAFRSTDGTISGGYFREYRNHRFATPQLLLLDGDRIYAPLATEGFELPCGNGLLAIPAFPAGPGKEIPFTPAASAPGKVVTTLHWNREGLPARLEYLDRAELAGIHPVLRVENFTEVPFHAEIFDHPISVPAGEVRSYPLPMPESASHQLEWNGEIQLSFAPETIPPLLPRAEAEKTAPVHFESELGETTYNPADLVLRPRKGAEKTQFGWRMTGTDAHLTLGTPETVFRKKLYLECVFKFEREPEGIVRGEFELLYATTPHRNEGRSMELRYNRHHRAVRFLLTTGNETYYDLSAFDTPLEPGRWHHAIAGWDGKEQLLIVNGVRYSRSTPIELKEYAGPWQLGPGFNGLAGRFRLGGE